MFVELQELHTVMDAFCLRRIHSPVFSAAISVVYFIRSSRLPADQPSTVQNNFQYGSYTVYHLEWTVTSDQRCTEASRLQESFKTFLSVIIHHFKDYINFSSQLKRLLSILVIYN